MYSSFKWSACDTANALDLLTTSKLKTPTMATASCCSAFVAALLLVLATHASAVTAESTPPPQPPYYFVAKHTFDAIDALKAPHAVRTSLRHMHARAPSDDKEQPGQHVTASASVHQDPFWVAARSVNESLVSPTTPSSWMLASGTPYM